jgi:hypothetical protein
MLLLASLIFAIQGLRTILYPVRTSFSALTATIRSRNIKSRSILPSILTHVRLSGITTVIVIVLRLMYSSNTLAPLKPSVYVLDLSALIRVQRLFYSLTVISHYLLRQPYASNGLRPNTRLYGSQTIISMVLALGICGLRDSSASKGIRLPAPG